jgi:hypothetical protein
MHNHPWQKHVIFKTKQQTSKSCCTLSDINKLLEPQVSHSLTWGYFMRTELDRVIFIKQGNHFAPPFKMRKLKLSTVR